MVRTLIPGLLLALLILAPLAVVDLASASHKPYYKSSVDHLDPGTWEGHFVWLRNPYFTYTGQVYWQFTAEGGVIDAIFMTWWEFQNFREGRPFQPLGEPQTGIAAGAEGATSLSVGIPYLLVFQNSGDEPVTVTWELFAEIDWRRLGQENPGQPLNLTFQTGSPLLAKGESWETSLLEPGHYRYYCDPHADMTALIEVVPAEAPDAPLAVAIRDFGFHPEVIRIPAGTPLLWTNHDGVEHSVQIELLSEGIPPEAPTLPQPGPTFPWWLLLLVPVAGAVVVVLWVRRRQRSA